MGETRARGSRRRRGRRAPALAAVLACVVLLPAAAAIGARPGPSTRADLDLLRRRVALLESELALARSRKPYLVVDAPEHRLRYGLLGMTVRQIPSSAILIDGLKRGSSGSAPGLQALAGIVTLREKEQDPRLAPLTPEQIEGGAADENVADALPPEALADFNVQFNQPIALRVEGIPGKKSAWAGAFGWWARLRAGGGGGGNRIGLRLAVHVEETAAREIYRSLVPGERLLLVAPNGFFLPDAGQESPRSVRAGRPARPPSPQAGPLTQGVPFRIPPPVDGDTAGGESHDGDGAGVPAAATTPEPARPPEDPPAEGPPPEETPPDGTPGSPPDAGGQP